MNVTWVTWKGSKRAHAARVDPRDVRVGSFPLLCGRWAPDGFDTDVHVSAYGRPCSRCEKALAARQNLC